MLEADGGRIASRRMLLDNFSPMNAAAPPNWFGGLHGGKDQHGRAAKSVVGGDGTVPVGQTSGEGALCATTGWHRKHAVRALRRRATVGPDGVEAPRERKRRYDATIKDAMTAL